MIIHFITRPALPDHINIRIIRHTIRSHTFKIVGLLLDPINIRIIRPTLRSHKFNYIDILLADHVNIEVTLLPHKWGT